MLGRIRIVQDEISARRGRRLSQILDYGDRAHLRNEPYGWCWALAEFLDGHPAYRDRFRSLARHAGDVQFNQRLRKIFSDDWGRLNDAWLVFAFGIEHAYDFKRSAIDFQPGEPLGKASRTVTIDADRGWQSSRFALLAGTTYRIEAQGHYQVAKQADGTAWPCEPGGVTLRYYKGRPLGILLGAVVPEEVPLGVAPQDRVTPLVQPWTVGLGGRWTPKSSGTLYLRINDSAGQLGDNQGTLTVVVAQATAGR